MKNPQDPAILFAFLAQGTPTLSLETGY